jgi:hypothetical protein|tara:strand:- start:7147 stop:8277 length:1131 start_codon:yes stop_codon:yes gene_type:complete
MATDYQAMAARENTYTGQKYGSAAPGYGGKSAQPASPKAALDAAVNTINSGSALPAHLVGQNAANVQGLKRQYSADAANASALQGLNDAMYTMTGGPNAALIAQMNAQKAQYAANYSQNKADVNNLYGTLTEDITEYGGNLQTRYGTTMGEMDTAQSQYQQNITDTRAGQQDNRAAAAAELGLSAESLQAAPSTAMDEIAATSGAAAENWKNLFSANQLFEQSSTDRQVTGANNTKSNQLLGMKRYLDSQNMALDAQIAAEKGKTATQELTDVGRTLRGAQVEQTLKYAQSIAPGIYGSGSEAEKTSLMQGFSDSQKDIFNNTGQQYDQEALTDMLRKISQKRLSKSIQGDNAGNALTLEESILARNLKFNVSDLG